MCTSFRLVQSSLAVACHSMRSGSMRYRSARSSGHVPFRAVESGSIARGKMEPLYKCASLYFDEVHSKNMRVDTIYEP